MIIKFFLHDRLPWHPRLLYVHEPGNKFCKTQSFMVIKRKSLHYKPFLPTNSANIFTQGTISKYFSHGWKSTMKKSPVDESKLLTEQKNVIFTESLYLRSLCFMIFHRLPGERMQPVKFPTMQSISTIHTPVRIGIWNSPCTFCDTQYLFHKTVIYKLQVWFLQDD